MGNGKYNRIIHDLLVGSEVVWENKQIKMMKGRRGRSSQKEKEIPEGDALKATCLKGRWEKAKCKCNKLKKKKPNLVEKMYLQPQKAEMVVARRALCDNIFGKSKYERSGRGGGRSMSV